MSDIKKAEASLEKKADSILKKFKSRRSWQVLGAIIFGLVVATLVFNTRAGNDSVAVIGFDRGNCDQSGGTIVKETNSAEKRNATVCQLSGGAFRSNSFRYNSQANKTFTDAYNFLKSKGYTRAQSCFYVKGVNGSAVVDLHAFGDTNADTRDVTISGNDYGRYCSEASLTTSSTQNSGVTLKSGVIRFSSIVIEGKSKSTVVEPVEPVEPVNPTGQWPSERTTGFAGAGVSVSELRPYTGSTITQSGITLDKMDFSGCIRIGSGVNNVTIKRSRLRSSCFHGIDTLSAGSNIRIEDMTIIGTSNSAGAGVYGNNFTCLRCDVSGTVDGIKTGNNSNVLDSYIHDLRKFSGTHNDGIQNSGGASNILIKGNRIMGPYQTSTSAIIAQTNVGPINNMVIENNYLHGGSYTVYLRDKGTGYGSPTNSAIRNNVFVKSSTGVFKACVDRGGSAASCNTRGNFVTTSGGVQVTGNTWQDGTSF